MGQKDRRLRRSRRPSGRHRDGQGPRGTPGMRGRNPDGNPGAGRRFRRGGRSHCAASVGIRRRLLRLPSVPARQMQPAGRQAGRGSRAERRNPARHRTTRQDHGRGRARLHTPRRRPRPPGADPAGAPGHAPRHARRQFLPVFPGGEHGLPGRHQHAHRRPVRKTHRRPLQPL